MKHVITTALLAGALAVSCAACSEDTERSWKQASDSTEQALERTGEDVRRGTGHALHDTGQALERGGDELRDDARDVARDDDAKGANDDDATHG